MLDFDALQNATYEDIKAVRSMLSRLLTQMIRANVAHALPYLEVEYRLKKWEQRIERRETNIVRGQLVQVTAGSLAIREQDEGRERYIHFRQIVSVNGEPIDPVEFQTPRSLKVHHY